MELDSVMWLRKRCLERFRYFCQLFQPPEWFDSALHGDLCDFMQDCQASDKLVVLPRSHLKTTYVGTLYPLWRATKDPTSRILIASNTATNAQKTLMEIMGIVEGHQNYRALFPDRIPDFGKVRWSAAGGACLARPRELPESTFEAIGVGGNVTRRHFNLIIEDDTIAPKKDEMTGEELMPSPIEIEKAVGWHKLTLPLLVSIRHDERVFIGTRWAYYDVISHIQGHEITEKHKGGRYQEFNRPAVDTITGKIAFKRFDDKSLEQIKASMGPFLYSALYLNAPLHSSEMRFHPEWTRYYQEEEISDLLTSDAGRRVVTVDPADPPTGKEDQCFTAIVSAINAPDGRVIVRRYRKGRFTDMEMVKAAFDLAEMDDAHEIRVEVDRYAHLEHAFKLEMAERKRWFVIRAVKTRGRSKDARIMRIQPIHENGLLWLKDGMHELEGELYQYPHGRFVDLLDALAWQVMPEEGFRQPGVEGPKRELPRYGRMTFTMDQMLASLAGAGAESYPTEYFLHGKPVLTSEAWTGEPVG